MSLRIVTDSTCDLDPEEANALGIEIVPLTVYFGEQGFLDRVEMTPAAFYRRLAETRAFPRTSQPASGAFEDAYRRLAAGGATEILSVHISSKLSGTLNSAQVAAAATAGVCAIRVMDSQSVAGGLGALAMTAASMAAKGATMSAVEQALSRMIPRHQVTILLDTLEYLQRGGRIGRARALLGGVLNVKPIVRLQDGEVGAGERVRSRRKGIELVFNGVMALPDVERVIVEHTGSEAEAEELATRFRRELPDAEIELRWIGPVVGAYVGPGGIGAVAVQKPAP